MYLNVLKPYDASKRILDILIEEDRENMVIVPEDTSNVQDSVSGVNAT